jgi:hypothetical protein
MKEYTVSAQMTISVYTIVQAENEQEAKKLAQDRPNGSPCHQAFGDGTEVWIADDLDGVPVNITVEEN